VNGVVCLTGLRLVCSTESRILISAHCADMERRDRLLRLASGLLLLGCLGASAPLAATDVFVWKAQQDRVDADIEAWPLARVLETITAATGWQVYLEPGTEHAVTRISSSSPSTRRCSDCSAS
jgi:hypothetical protein